MERGQTLRQQGNVGTEQELSAFNLSALQIRLKILNPSTLGQMMGLLQRNAVLQMQPPATGRSCKTVNASLNVTGKTQTLEAPSSETPADQRWCTMQQTQPSYRRKRHVSARGQQGCTRTGRSPKRTSLRVALRQRPRKRVFVHARPYQNSQAVNTEVCACLESWVNGKEGLKVFVSPEIAKQGFAKRRTGS